MANNMCRHNIYMYIYINMCVCSMYTHVETCVCTHIPPKHLLPQIAVSNPGKNQESKIQNKSKRS